MGRELIGTLSGPSTKTGVEINMGMCESIQTAAGSIPKREII